MLTLTVEPASPLTTSRVKTACDMLLLLALELATVVQPVGCVGAVPFATDTCSRSTSFSRAVAGITGEIVVPVLVTAAPAVRSAIGSIT